MRVEHRAGILRLRALMDSILFLGEENVWIVREIASAKSEPYFEASFGLQSFVYLKREPNL
jgi:hypothetical protein